MLDELDKEIKAISVKLNRAIVCGHKREVKILTEQYEQQINYRRWVQQCQEEDRIHIETGAMIGRLWGRLDRNRWLS